MLAYNSDTNSDSHFIPPPLQPLRFRLFIRSAHLSYNDVKFGLLSLFQFEKHYQPAVLGIWMKMKIRLSERYEDCAQSSGGSGLLSSTKNQQPRYLLS